MTNEATTRTFMNVQDVIIQVFMTWKNFDAFTRAVYVIEANHMNVEAASYHYGKTVESGIVWG